MAQLINHVKIKGKNVLLVKSEMPESIHNIKICDAVQWNPLTENEFFTVDTFNNQPQESIIHKRLINGLIKKNHLKSIVFVRLPRCDVE